MKLVDYLRALLSRFYSKKESALIGHQAMPAVSLININCPSVFTDWNSYVTGTATCDGYLQISGKSTDPNASVVLYGASLNSNISAPFNGGGFGGSIAIAKGESYSVQGSNMSHVTLCLVKTVGEISWGGG